MSTERKPDLLTVIRGHIANPNRSILMEHALASVLVAAESVVAENKRLRTVLSDLVGVIEEAELMPPSLSYFAVAKELISQ